MGPSIVVPPNVVKFYLFFLFTYSEKFDQSIAYEVKKFVFWPSRLRGPPFWNPKFVKFYLCFIKGGRSKGDKKSNKKNTKNVKKERKKTVNQ